MDFGNTHDSSVSSFEGQLNVQDGTLMSAFLAETLGCAPDRIHAKVSRWVIFHACGRCCSSRRLGSLDVFVRPLVSSGPVRMVCRRSNWAHLTNSSKTHRLVSSTLRERPSKDSVWHCKVRVCRMDSRGLVAGSGVVCSRLCLSSIVACLKRFRCSQVQVGMAPKWIAIVSISIFRSCS